MRCPFAPNGDSSKARGDHGRAGMAEAAFPGCEWVWGGGLHDNMDPILTAVSPAPRTAPGTEPMLDKSLWHEHKNK